MRRLREQYIPPLSPTGLYSTIEYDHVRAFRLLVHAEIENYLETIGGEVINAAVNRWKVDKVPRRAVLGLIAFHGVTMPPTTALNQQRPVELEARVDECRTRYFNARSKNHGIKEKNALLLLLPAGLAEYQLSSGLLSDLETFGNQRGQVAHTTFAAQSPPDPGDALRIVTRLLSRLRTLDSLLVELRDE